MAYTGQVFIEWYTKIYEESKIKISFLEIRLIFMKTEKLKMLIVFIFQ